jgi:hypothetical protein
MCNSETFGRLQWWGDRQQICPYTLEAAMKPLRCTLLAVLVLGLPVTACSSEQAAPIDTEGWLSATIQRSPGAAEENRLSYSGTGVFRSSSDFPDLPPEVPEFFTLFSVGVGNSIGQQISLARVAAERPEVGSYSIIGPQRQPGHEGWIAHYQATRGDSVAQYATIEGELEITASSAEQVEGRFTFQLVHTSTCSTDWWRAGFDPEEVLESPCVWHLERDIPLTELPVTEISGSFSVINRTICDGRDHRYDPTRIGIGPIGVICRVDPGGH